MWKCHIMKCLFLKFVHKNAPGSLVYFQSYIYPKQTSYVHLGLCNNCRTTSVPCYLKLKFSFWHHKVRQELSDTSLLWNDCIFIHILLFPRSSSSATKLRRTKKSPQRKEKSERRMARTERESGSKEQEWKKGELFFLGSKAIYSLPLLSIHFVPHWPQGEWGQCGTHPSITVLQDPMGFALWGGISQQRRTCDEISTTSTVWLFPLPPFSRWTDLLSLQRLHRVSLSTAKGRALNIPNKHIQYETKAGNYLLSWKDGRGSSECPFCAA